MKVYWLEQNEDDVPAHCQWLSAAETARMSEFRIAKRRDDWRRGRWTAKRTVAAYLGLPDDSAALRRVEIWPAPSGAPEVFIGERPAPVTISLSHRGAYAVCGAVQAEALIGCDLEIVEDREESFVADYFAPEEQALLARVAEYDRPWLVTLLWSAKESGLKAVRAGLRLDTRLMIAAGIDVSDSGAGWHSLCVRQCSGPVLRGWWRRTGELIRTVVADPSPYLPENCRLHGNMT